MKIRRIKQSSALQKKLRVAAYARVSVDTLHHSFAAQVSYYSSLIQKNPSWEYAGVYADEGITGTSTTHRTEFKRLIADCNAGKIDLVLVKSISRFARDTVDFLHTVRRLKEKGIAVRFERENIDSTSEDGELLLTLLASFAQEESRSSGDNSPRGFRTGINRLTATDGTERGSALSMARVRSSRRYSGDTLPGNLPTPSQRHSRDVESQDGRGDQSSRPR